EPATGAHNAPGYLPGRRSPLPPPTAADAAGALGGEPGGASLRESREPVDVVDVFRRSEQVAEHVDEILALRPALVWLQSGIRNDAAARTLEDAGITVVQDRCLMVEHRRLFG